MLLNTLQHTGQPHNKAFFDPKMSIMLKLKILRVLLAFFRLFTATLSTTATTIFRGFASLTETYLRKPVYYGYTVYYLFG